MTLKETLATHRADRYVVLILDNEVTVGEFVVAPPLPWARIVQLDGVFQIADGYPNTLTAAQGNFEMKNWDEVSLPGIMRTLGEVGDALDFVVIGNNAGQGLPLAQALPQTLRPAQAAIIYASSLPEQSAYEQLGYRCFIRRRETAVRLLTLAKAAGRPLALYFMNSIQHNERNYHDP
jgi:hypothetical protein